MECLHLASNILAQEPRQNFHSKLRLIVWAPTPGVTGCPRNVQLRAALSSRPLHLPAIVVPAGPTAAGVQIVVGVTCLLGRRSFTSPHHLLIFTFPFTNDFSFFHFLIFSKYALLKVDCLLYDNMQEFGHSGAKEHLPIADVAWQIYSSFTHLYSQVYSCFSHLLFFIF